jgi:hypothetical protein
MYSQFERKTILIIEKKISEGLRNNNNPVLNDEDKVDVLIDLVPSFSLFKSLNYLNHSLLSIIA